MQLKRGFTLVELLVVIAIIGLLTGVVLASVSGARTKGRDAKRVSDVKELQLALELYYDACSNFPTALNATAGSGCTNDLVTNGYISVLPTDPGQSGSCTDGTQASCYGYVATPTNCNNSTTLCTGYVLATQLESSNSALNGSYTGTGPEGNPSFPGGTSLGGTTGGNAPNQCNGAPANLLFCVTP